MDKAVLLHQAANPITAEMGYVANMERLAADTIPIAAPDMNAIRPQIIA